LKRSVAFSLCCLVGTIAISRPVHAQWQIPFLVELGEGLAARIAVGTAAREIAAEAASTAIARGAAAEAGTVARGLAEGAKLELNASRAFGSSGRTTIGAKVAIDGGTIAAALAPSLNRSDVAQSHASFSRYDGGMGHSSGSVIPQPAPSPGLANGALKYESDSMAKLLPGGNLSDAEHGSGPKGQGLAEGSADRRVWENWFAGLTGTFREGAEYWAGQRSLPRPGLCYGVTGQRFGDWSAGCTAAKRLLGPTDVRRRSEPAYRAGWNDPAMQVDQLAIVGGYLPSPIADSRSPWIDQDYGGSTVGPGTGGRY
jgi:hypothetical protein